MDKFEVLLTDEHIQQAMESSKLPVPLDDCNPQLQAILGLPRPLQHTPEWFQQRRTMLTASNVSSFLGLNPYCTRRRFLRTVQMELRKPPTCESPLARNPACLWGQRYETEAAVLYHLVTGNRYYPEDIGLVVHQTLGHLGASPDRALVDTPVLVEIKAPWKRVIEPEVIPPQYIPQVQAQMEVCDMDVCHFVQFKPATLCAPGILSVLVVKRDKEWWAKYEDELSTFAVELAKTEVPEEKPSKRRKASSPSTSTSNPSTSTTTAIGEMTTIDAGNYRIFLDKQITPSSEFCTIVQSCAL